MRTFLRFLLCLFVSFNVLGQQAKIREVDNVTVLRSHVQDLDRTRYVKGYWGIGDGGSGLFVFTNTALSTNLGTRFGVIGQGYSWERQHDGQINVKWFGAKGDGATDDAARVQAAVNYASANNFAVYMPASRYVMVAAITLPSNTIIYGEGLDSEIVSLNGFTVSGVTNVTISKLKFTGPYSKAVNVTSATNVTVERIMFQGSTKSSNTNAPVEVVNSSLVTVDKNEFTLHTVATDYLILLDTSTKSRVTGNYIGGLYNLSGILLTSCDQSYVRDNVVSNALPGLIGIELGGTNVNLSVEDNWIYGGAFGIKSTGKTNSISNNHIFKTTSTALNISGPYHLVNENIILDSTLGILLDTQSSNSIVTANRVYNNTGYAIRDIGNYNLFAHNTLIGGTTGFLGDGINGILMPNLIQGHATGLLINGAGYRVDDITRVHENTIPISDPGGAIIKTITSGASPSVKDSPAYLLNFATPTTITSLADGLIGMRRVFFAGNTNASIAHNSAITLDGAGTFKMLTGDVLVLEMDTTGVWRQVGKSINADWMYYDQANLLINLNRNVSHNFANYLQTVAPGTTTWPEDHVVSNDTVANTLLSRWMLTGSIPANNTTVLALKSSPDKTNGVVTINGVDYQFPRTNGVVGLVLGTDGGTPQKLYWTNIGGGAAYTFEPTQFSSGGGLVAITNGALTTNLVLKGAVTAPVLNVSGVNIDAATGTEFSKTLASNTTLGIINMVDGQAVSLTVTNTTFTLSFTNAITWISGVVPVIDTNAVNVFHFFRTGGRILGSDPEQLANGNVYGLATMTGTGVVVKTNSSTFVTFNPLPIRFGGTGTNSLGGGTATGNILFHDLANDMVDVDDTQFTYDKGSHILNLIRNAPTGVAQLQMIEGSAGSPMLSLYANKILEAEDDLTIDAATTNKNIFLKISGTNVLKASGDFSVIIGRGLTTTTRTNNHLYIPTFAGTPTGVPRPETGTVAMGYNTSGNLLYVYNGGWNAISGGGSTFSGVANGVVYSPDGVNLTNNANFIFTPTQMSLFGANPLLIQNTGSDNLTMGGSTINFNPFTVTDGEITFPVGGFRGFNIKAVGSTTNVIRIPGSQSVMLGIMNSTNVARTTNFLYMQNTRGVPTGTPVADGGIPITIDTVNNRLYGYNGSWINLSGSGGPSFLSGLTDQVIPKADSSGTNLVNSALGMNLVTNLTIGGKAFATDFVASNAFSFSSGSASFSPIGLTMINNGGTVTVLNNSATTGSSLTLKGGTGAGSSLIFNSGNAVRGSFDSNGVLHAAFGIEALSLALTNALPIPSGGTGTNSFGILTGNVIYMGATNRMAADSGHFTYDAANQILEVIHSTSTTSPMFIATDSDTSAILNLYANRLSVANSDLTIEQANSSRNINFTNNAALSLRLTPEWSTVVGDGTTTTTRTNKLLYIPTFAGTPTGVPSTETGRAAIGYDTTGSKLMVYNAGWQDIGGSGGGGNVTRLHVESAKLPATNPARINNVSDYLWEILFDASTSQSAGWSFIMPQDYGSALTLRFKTSCKSGQTGVKSAIYRFYVAAMKATEDPTNPTFSSANSSTVTYANNQTANQIVETTVTLTNNDTVAAGDLVIIKADRDAANGSDDVVGDSTLVGSIAVEWIKQ